jgi:putative ABC transport system ATP-binding protein
VVSGETGEAKQRFIEGYKATGTISGGARHAGVSRNTVYQWMKSDPHFAEDVKQVRVEIIDSLEEAAIAEAQDRSGLDMLSVKNLTRIYKLGNVEVRALDDVSLSVEEGDITCIMGKSGSGKSTLLRQLGLIDTPTSGRIILDGRDVTKLSDSARARLRLAHLGYIFQEFALLAELTAHENVYLPGMMLGAKKIDYKNRAKELLELVELGERINHKPRELSGGEQQRVAIARALINDPRVLFADEPCANLDTVSAELVMGTLVQLNRELGVTIVFVSHDPDDKKYANKFIFLKDGRQVPEYI